MPQRNDDKDQVQTTEQETGFGTGLRRQLERRRFHEPYDGEPLVESEVEEPELEEEHADEAEPEPTEAEEFRLELEAALSREARLRAALAEQQGAREYAEHLERELDAARSELEALRQEHDEAQASLSPRQFLREQVERHVEALWSVFEQALDATHPDGAPDFGTRLEAARALLSEAYDHDGDNALPSVETARDELAGLRARRAGQPPQ